MCKKEKKKKNVWTEVEKLGLVIVPPFLPSRRFFIYPGWEDCLQLAEEAET